MSKENRFEGLMGAVGKSKNVPTSKSLDAQTSRTRKKTSLSADVQTSDNLDNQASEVRVKSNISTSKSLNVQTSKAKSTNPDYTRTTLYLPKKMHKRLKAIAVEEEREMSEIVEELLGDWLESRSHI